MNLRIVYRSPHGEPVTERWFTNIGRMRVQGGLLLLWVEGHEMDLHAHSAIPMNLVELYDADCIVLESPDDTVLFDALKVFPDQRVPVYVPPLKAVLQAWLRKKSHAVRSRLSH